MTHNLLLKNFVIHVHIIFSFLIEIMGITIKSWSKTANTSAVCGFLEVKAMYKWMAIKDDVLFDNREKISKIAEKMIKSHKINEIC